MTGAVEAEGRGDNIPAPEVFDDPAVERVHRRQRVAAGYRMLSRFGLDEGIAGHITCRDPERTDHFWTAPFGAWFGAVRASDLILVNDVGEVVEGRGPLNVAAFAIHSAIHRARPDVVGAVHAHGLNGKAFATLGRPLAPLTQDACAFYGSHGVFEDFTGVVLDPDEGKRIAACLGEGKALILANHGHLTVGQTVDSALFWFLTMERSCQAELLARAAGEPREIPPATARLTHEQVGREDVGWFAFQPIWRRLVAEQPDLLE
ncbi:MAG TPA: class II aldolase/adducin family protein [Pseudonocardia sp.]|nr:class II aldolase/adducin family protein [Pseudonocardia sp.]